MYVEQWPNHWRRYAGGEVLRPQTFVMTRTPTYWLGWFLQLSWRI